MACFEYFRTGDEDMQTQREKGRKREKAKNLIHEVFPKDFSHKNCMQAVLQSTKKQNPMKRLQKGDNHNMKWTIFLCAY